MVYIKIINENITMFAFWIILRVYSLLILLIMFNNCLKQHEK